MFVVKMSLESVVGVDYAKGLNEWNPSPLQLRRICRWFSMYPPKRLPDPQQLLTWDNDTFMMGTPVLDDVKRCLNEQTVVEDSETVEEESESLLECHGCGKRMVDMFTRQTRSADEPETIFAHCRNCGKRWRQ